MVFFELTHWHWIISAVVLVIGDVLLGTSFFLLWLGVGAFSVGILLLLIPSMSWEYQFLIFALEAISSTFLWRQYLRKNGIATDKPRLNRRSEQYIGRIFTLEEPIANGRGKIKVEDSTWIVAGEDMPEGTQIKVIHVDGVILHVEKIK